MSAKEMSESVGNSLSPRTVKTRQSHVKKIENILRSEFPSRTRGKNVEDVLGMVSVETIEHVSAWLSRDNIRTGANYLSSWINGVGSKELNAKAKMRRRRCARALNKCRGAARQAAEVPLRELIHHPSLRDAPQWFTGARCFHDWRFRSRAF